MDPALADSNLYRYCGNMPTEAIDPSGFELQILGVSADETPDSSDVQVQQLIRDTNAKLCDFVLDLYRVTDQQYAKLQGEGKVKINGKPVYRLTKEQLIARVEREQSSELVEQTSGGFPEAKRELASLAERFTVNYEYDALAILVHGEPTAFMIFNDIPVDRETAIPALRKIGESCKAEFVIVSCYNNPGGKQEGYMVVPAQGKVGWWLTRQGNTWVPNKSKDPCFINFNTYRLKKGYKGANDKEMTWLGWDDTYEKYSE
jgi:hypothetical protein